jgi:hypothetical protein
MLTSKQFGMTEEEGRLRTQSALMDLMSRGDPSGRRSRRAARKLLSEEVGAAWHNFPNLPGDHVSMRRAARGSWELVNDSSGSVSVRCAHKTSVGVPHTVTSQGRTYVWRPVAKRKGLASSRVEDLVNLSTNAPVLRMSGLHSNYRAGTRLTLVGQRELRFPVKGYSWRALMSAIDESGNSLIEYRLVPSKRRSLLDRYAWTEAVVSPTALTIPDIEVLVAVSSTFLLGYFQTGGGAG